MFSDQSSRPKRSPNNPLGFLTDAKQFIIDANSLSFDEVFQNLGSNVDFGIIPTYLYTCTKLTDIIFSCSIFHFQKTHSLGPHTYTASQEV